MFSTNWQVMLGAPAVRGGPGPLGALVPELTGAVRHLCPEVTPTTRYVHFSSRRLAERAAASGVLLTSEKEWQVGRGTFGVPEGGKFVHAVQTRGVTGRNPGEELAAVMFTTPLPPYWSEPREACWLVARLPLDTAEVLDLDAAISLLDDQLVPAWRLADGRRWCHRPRCRAGGCQQQRPGEEYEVHPFPLRHFAYLEQGSNSKQGDIRADDVSLACSLEAAVPDVPALAAELNRRREDARSPRMLIHGPAHWRQVATAGLRLLEQTPAADPVTVYLFAVLHDAARIGDGLDDWHGSRAAGWLPELRAAGLLQLPDTQAAVLSDAITYHSAGEVTTHPTIAVCWDADRLDLWRIHTRPWPGGLSTDAARGSIEWARRLRREALGWEVLWDAYQNRCLQAEGPTVVVGP